MKADPTSREIWACIDCDAKREVHLSQYARNGKTKENYRCIRCANKHRFSDPAYKEKQVKAMKTGKQSYDKLKKRDIE